MISSVEVITKEQLDNAGLIIFHVQPRSNCEVISKAIYERLQKAGYKGQVLVTSVLHCVEAREVA